MHELNEVMTWLTLRIPSVIQRYNEIAGERSEYRALNYLGGVAQKRLMEEGFIWTTGGKRKQGPTRLTIPPSGCHVHTNLTEKDQTIGNRSLWGQEPGEG